MELKRNSRIANMIMDFSLFLKSRIIADTIFFNV